MKLLITGASGFIGRNLVESMSSKYTVLAPSSTELDLLDEEATSRYLTKNPVDCIIHTACKPGHRNAKDTTGVFYADCRMFFNLFRNRDHFDKMLITGSGAIYDMRHYVPKMKEEYSGTHVPFDEHGFFRYVTSHLISNDKKLIDLRLFGVFGKYEDYSIRFISNCICKVLFDLPITMRQNRRFDYLHVDDLIPVLEYFLHHDSQHTTYNVTPNEAVELLDIARLVLRVAGKDLPILVEREGLGLEYSGDNSRLRAEIHDLTFAPLAKTIERLYGWYNDHKDRIDRELLLTDK